MDGRPNRRNKAEFSDFFGVVWKLSVKLSLIDKTVLCMSYLA